MADPNRELLDEVLTGAKAMGSLAKDEEAFRGAVDAFRAQDGESMGLLLEHHKLADRCEIVCHWLRSKEAVLLCLELAGPPPLEQVDVPDPREFAEVVAKLTADHEAVELMANAVQERDTSAWSELISQYRLERYSHLLCHWVSTVHYRLVCEVVCRPFDLRLQRPHLIPELRAAGAALGSLAADREVFATAAEAVHANRCEGLAGTLADAGYAPFCFFLCEWFCSWRCTLVCLRLCQFFPLEKIESPIHETLEFARAGAELDKSQLERLAAATLREDVDQVQALAKELNFERFCLQFCHWVCFLRCQLFCVCVCPPRSLGVFTKIGALYYDSTDVHSHSGQDGLTQDKRAFYSTLRLNGGLSLVAGAPEIEYRFQTIETSDTGSTGANTWQAVVPTQIAATNIGSFTRYVAGPVWIETIPVWVNKDAAAPGFDIEPDAEGWIKVPPMFPSAPMVSGSGWRFVPGADLIKLVTPTLAPTVKEIDETGVIAGGAGNAPLQTDRHYGIRMRIRDQGTSGDGSDAGTCVHVAINNSHYEKVSHHPYWKGGLFGAKHELALASLGIEELRLSPCSLLTNTLTVNFTAAHSHLGQVDIWLEGGPSGPYQFDLPAQATSGENWYGTAVPHTPPTPLPATPSWTFGALSPCAYLLKLSVQALLTDGDANASPLLDQIAFCKG